MDRTFIIIKPDAVAKQYTGKIIAHIEKEGFQILGLRMLQLDRGMAEAFYAVHKERPFFDSLVSFMISAPVVVGALLAPDAVSKWRNLIGATDPTEAADNTIRKLYAESKEKNAVHGSDSDETAKAEIAFFFKGNELVLRAKN